MTYLSDIWFPGACFVVGVTVGAVIMHYQNKNLIKRHQYQSMEFVNMITGLIVKEIKLREINNSMLDLINELLSKKG